MTAPSDPGNDQAPGGACGEQPGTRDDSGASRKAADERGEPYLEDVYAVAYESNARVRHWLCDIYDLHGLPQNPQLRDAPHRSPLQSPTLRSLRLLVSLRYLILELWSFHNLYSNYTKMRKGLDVKDTGALKLIIEGHSVVDKLKPLRNMVAHAGATLGEFAAEVESLGLDSFVHYARAVLMFEDATYRTVSHKNYRLGKPDWDRDLPRLTFEIPGTVDRDAFAKKYSNVGPAPDMHLHQHDYAILNDLRLLLLTFYAGFIESARGTEDNSLDSLLRLTDHVYNIKYMILDIHNFIEKFEKLDLGQLVKPGFLSRRELYKRLRHDYSVHTRAHEIRDIDDLLGKHPDLISDLLLDIVEVDTLLNRMLARLEIHPIRDIPLMSRGQIEEIDRKMKDIQLESHRRLGDKYIDPDEESKRRRARELAKQSLGLR